MLSQMFKFCFIVGHLLAHGNGNAGSCINVAILLDITGIMDPLITTWEWMKGVSSSNIFTIWKIPGGETSILEILGKYFSSAL